MVAMVLRTKAEGTVRDAKLNASDYSVNDTILVDPSVFTENYPETFSLVVTATTLSLLEKSFEYTFNLAELHLLLLGVERAYNSPPKMLEKPDWEIDPESKEIVVFTSTISDFEEDFIEFTFEGLDAISSFATLAIEDQSGLHKSFSLTVDPKLILKKDYKSHTIILTASDGQTSSEF
jgi:hypothetical protein